MALRRSRVPRIPFALRVHAAADARNRDQHQRHERDGQQREAGVGQERGNDRRGEDHDVAGDRDERRAERGVQGIDILRDPVHQLAAARSGEERERQPLHVQSQLRSQIAHNCSARGDVVDFFADAEHADEGAGDEHAESVEDDQAGVVGGHGDVDDVAHEERRQRARHGRQHGEDHDQQGSVAMRSDQPEDAAEHGSRFVLRMSGRLVVRGRSRKGPGGERGYPCVGRGRGHGRCREACEKRQQSTDNKDEQLGPPQICGRRVEGTRWSRRS